jgi:hypothetical protein
MPFAADAFEFIVCRAAFKNFSDPIGALHEMHRVLRPGGTALILDMRKDASRKSINEEVAKMHLGRIDAFLTRTALSTLRKRAYSKLDFDRMAQATPFGRCDIREEPLGFEITLSKQSGKRRRPSSAEQPEQCAEDDADKDAGGERKVECDAAALEYDVARETPEADAGQYWPYDPDDKDHQSKPDQKALPIHWVEPPANTWERRGAASRPEVRPNSLGLQAAAAGAAGCGLPRPCGVSFRRRRNSAAKRHRGGVS